MADYLIPFGVDPKEFDNGINAMEKSVEQLVGVADEAGKEMSTSMNKAVESGEKLGTTIAADTAQLIKLKNEAKAVGASLATSLNAPNTGSELEKRISRFQSLMTALTATAANPISLNIDASKLEAIGKALEEGADDLQILGDLAGFVRQQLATMLPTDAGFAELSQNVAIIEGFMEGLAQASQDAATGGEVLEASLSGVNASMEGVDENTKTLRARLREVENAMYELAAAGKQNTDEFRDLQAEAVGYRETIHEVNESVETFAKSSKKLDIVVDAAQGLAGAFAAAQGALALFGVENEEAEKVIQKVTGAMALLQGVQQLAALFNKQSAIGSALASAAQVTQTGTTVALTTATTAEAAATVTATTATRGFTAALIANPITAIIVVIGALVAALIAFSSSSDDAKDATDSLNDSLEAQNRLLSLDEASVRRRTDLLAAQAKAAGAAESEITKIQGQGIAQRRNNTQAAFDEFIQNTYNNNALRKKADAETNSQIEDQYSEYTEKLKDLDNDLAIQRLEYSKQVSNESKAAAKTAQDNAKKANENAKKAVEERKKIIDQALKYTKESQDAETELIKSQYDRERTAAVNAADQKIAALENETALSVENQQKRADAILGINQVLTKKLDEIDLKEATDRAKLQNDANAVVNALRKEGAEKELEEIKIDFQNRRIQIETAYKDEDDLRRDLISQVNAGEIKALRLASDRIANEALQRQAEIEELQVETASKFVGKLPFLEEQKQIAVLEVKLKYAKKARELLLSQGKDENSPEVLAIKKDIIDLQKLIEDAGKDLDKKSGKGIINLQKLIFGDHTETENEAIAKALNVMAEGVRQITDYIIDQYQRQMDKRQEMIDMYDDSIDDLEDQLQDEKDARDAGFANNVAVLEAEIEEKKRLRAEEFQMQQELLEKQKTAQKVQLTLDTITQASNLITAASEIFATLSGIPFVGTALAIATIGVMIGGFIAAKAQAFSAVNNSKYETGGFIDGKSHAAGGTKYRAMDGSGSVVELESGEHVTRKNQAQKYAEVLEAINNDSLGDISDLAMRNLLSGLGVHLESDGQRQAIESIRERDDLRSVLFVSNNKTPEELKTMQADISYLAAHKRASRERWEDDNFYYERFGNKTRKIPKK